LTPLETLLYKGNLTNKYGKGRARPGAAAASS
jgi:hypothetical protein